MLRLTATDQSITMTTSATGSVDYISDWTDIVNATAVTTAGSGQGNVTTATTTTIIAAPASGSSRAVKSAMISNRHGSTSNTIQLFKTVGAASYAISKPLVILAGETVRFSDEGFCFVGNACDLEVTSATTAEQLESNATTGVMQIVGPAAGTTRVATIPDGNFTMARTDAAQTFTGNQTFSGSVLVDSITDATTITDGSLQTDGGLSVAKKSVLGKQVKILDTTASTSTTTGALTVAGGVGIGGDLYSGPVVITGTAETDGPTYGTELLSSSGWTSTEWTGDFVTGYTHTVGNTTALTNTLAAVIGNKYQMSYTITGRTTGSVTIAFGGQTVVGITVTGAFGPTATTVNGLSITPTTDFNGKIVITIKQITDGSAAAYTIKDSALSIKSELRAVSGAANIANGFQALYFNTTGYNNTAYGYLALYSNTTGYNNTADGYRALYSNTTGYSNTANGFGVGYENTTGYQNTYLGYNTGRGITTGISNTILGASVGSLAAGLSNNIILATGQGTIRMQFDGAKWKLNLAEVPAYANNAAAITGGLSAGNIYRTNGNPDTLCIVH